MKMYFSLHRIISFAARAPKCKTIVNIGYLLDSSGSLMNRYDEEKDLVKRLAGVFGVSEQGSRASVITYSTIAEQSIKFGEHKDLASFNAAVDAIPFMGHTTR